MGRAFSAILIAVETFDRNMCPFAQFLGGYAARVTGNAIVGRADKFGQRCDIVAAG
jgi:hypothetical protein